MDSKFMGALMGGVGALLLAIVFYYLIRGSGISRQSHSAFVAGLIAAILWLAGFTFAVISAMWNMHGWIDVLIYLFLITGSIIAIAMAVLVWRSKIGGSR